jgi:hypothetical protein
MVLSPLLLGKLAIEVEVGGGSAVTETLLPYVAMFDGRTEEELEPRGR